MHQPYWSLKKMMTVKEAVAMLPFSSAVSTLGLSSTYVSITDHTSNFTTFLTESHLSVFFFPLSRQLKCNTQKTPRVDATQHKALFQDT